MPQLADKLDTVTLDEVVGMVRDRVAGREDGDGGPP
jgi:hypothetical protein